MKNYSMTVSGDEKTFVQTATDFLEQQILSSIKAHNHAILGLSGGSTPKPIYELLGKSKRIDWSKVSIFLVDDRYIRSDDPKSNQFLLRSTLLKNAPIPESQIVFPDTTLPIDECILLYTQHLKALFQKRLPDIITLGMGDDGHIASLFPPVDDLALGDERLIVHTVTDKFDVRDRISVSLNLLANAEQAVFLLSGEGKKKVWEEMMASSEDGKRWPTKRVMEHARVTVFAKW